MLDTKKYDLQEKIAEIIRSSRSGEELSAIDAGIAAVNILQYLQAENMVVNANEKAGLIYSARSAYNPFCNFITNN